MNPCNSERDGAYSSSGLLLRPKLAEPAIWYELRKMAEPSERLSAAPQPHYLPPPPSHYQAAPH